MTELTLAIIGTAGRKDDSKKLSKDSFAAMCIVASGLLDQLKESNYQITHLVSGGAAWADHVAVKLFLQRKVLRLRLYIPCEFKNGSFSDNSSFQPIRSPLDGGEKFQFNPARTLNHYHSIFSRVTGINSLTEIEIAKQEGAEILPCRGGFHGRNAMVAKSDILLAMTFGDRNIVKEGGTADTVRKYLHRVRTKGFFNKSFHYNLNDGQIYKGIDTPPSPS